MVGEGLRRLWERRRGFHPDWIQVEVSADCNGACSYCPVSRLRDEREGGLMALETFARLIPSFPSTDLVFLQGWGEPLLHPELWEMVRLARDAGARVGFTTNGLLLDPEHREALLESGAEILGVSLAGATPHTHDRYRRGCPFEIVDRNLRALRREKEARGSPLPEVHLAYLLLEDNLEELPKAVELAGAWGGSQVVASHLSLVLDAEGEAHSLCTPPDRETETRAAVEEATHIPRVVEEAHRRARALGVSFRAHRAGSGEAAPACPENVLRSCFVSARGDVSPCVMCNLGLKPEGKATHRFQGRTLPLETLHFGNVLEESLEEIWWSPRAKAFRETFRRRVWRGTRGSRGLPGPCTHCYKITEDPIRNPRTAGPAIPP